MKKFFILLLFLLYGVLSVYAIEEEGLEDIGIAKYAVIEAKADFSPVREAPDENAKRFLHLRKGFVVYADKEYKNFYRIDLGEDKYYWMEKKYADIQAIIPQKRIQKAEQIKISEDKKKYSIFIPLEIQNSYSFKEVPDGLEFYLYDTDAKNAEIKNKPHCFTFSHPKDNILKVKYITPVLFGYEVFAHKKGLIVEIKKLPEINRKKPLKNIKIVLDPGHGGVDPGVCASGIKEKDINLKVSKQIKNALKKRGAKVYMTRKKDKYISLYDRVHFAQEKQGDILLSIHQNSTLQKNQQKHGTGTYYYNNQALALASNIQKITAGETKLKDDGINRASFALTRPTYPVSVLVECVYLTNKEDVQKITNKKFQKSFSHALAKGVENYLRYLIVF